MKLHFTTLDIFTTSALLRNSHVYNIPFQIEKGNTKTKTVFTFAVDVGLLFI